MHVWVTCFKKSQAGSFVKHGVGLARGFREGGMGGGNSKKQDI